MENEYNRYGLFLNDTLIEDYPLTVKGFREGIRRSYKLLEDSNPDDEDVFEVKAFSDSEEFRRDRIRNSANRVIEKYGDALRKLKD